MAEAAPATESLTLERVLTAPPERVYAAWTEPEHASQWFSPSEDYEAEAEIDARVGQDVADLV